MNLKQALAIHKHSLEGVNEETLKACAHVLVDALLQKQKALDELCQLWTPVYNYARNHPDITLGESVVGFALELMRKADALQEQKPVWSGWGVWFKGGDGMFPSHFLRDNYGIPLRFARRFDAVEKIKRYTKSSRDMYEPREYSLYAAPVAAPATSGLNPTHVGSDFDDFLREDGNYFEVACEVANPPGMTVAVFDAKKVPAGTKVFPQQAAPAAPAPSVPNNEFVQHLKKCKQDVEGWPEWKKQAAGIAPAVDSEWWAKLLAHPDITASSVNDAAWAVVKALPTCPPEVFNHIKGAFHRGLCEYLTDLAATVPTNTPATVDTPAVPAPSVPYGMMLVKAQDANNYCRILTLLGIEEEGDPVGAVSALLQSADHSGDVTGKEFRTSTKDSGVSHG